MESNPAKLPVSRDELPALLQAAGISPTAQRIEIAAVLLLKSQHLSAEQILARLDEGETAVSKATVYNTLGLFAERGLLREVMVDATRVFYDSNTAPHHHFYNVDDGTLTDIPDTEGVIGVLPEAPAGTTTERVELIVRVRGTR